MGAALKNACVSTELIADTFHVHPALFSIVNELKGELRGMREDVRDVRERQVKHEESLKSAWNRINELAQALQALTCGGKD